MSNLIATRCAFVTILAFGLACKDASHDLALDCAERPVLMGVASSLREVALSLREELSARPGRIDVEMIFGASSVHARQLAFGAPMDILVSADARIVEELVSQRILVPESATDIARGRLVLLASPSWPIGRPGVNALDSADLQRIALPSTAVPLGRYARSWLDAQGRLASLEGKIVTTEHARASLSAVEAGHVDLAIVYESDARLAHRAVELAQIDPSQYPPIRYVVARVVSAPKCPSIDEALEAWTSPATIERLARSGFLPAHSMEEL